MTKRRFWGIFATALVLTAAIGIFIWPFSLGNELPEKGCFTIFYNEVTPDGIRGEQYVVSADSPEATQISRALDRVSYHRCWRTFFPGESNNVGVGAGDTLTIQAEGDGGDTCLIIAGGGGEITINGTVYRVGYFGNQAALAMMEEIKSVLTRLNGGA